MSSLAGKTVLVTGASKGIGLSIKKKFEENGILAIGISRNKSKIKNHKICNVKSENDIIHLVDEIVKKAGIVDKKLLNLAGKTSLLGLAALIKGSQFFIGLDSVASHIAASVDKESITLFGPSNPVNWKPWSDKARIIAQEDLRYIEVKDVMSLVDEMPVE